MPTASESKDVQVGAKVFGTFWKSVISQVIDVSVWLEENVSLSYDPKLYLNKIFKILPMGVLY